MNNYKLSFVLGIVISIWFFCYTFLPKCSPPDDPDNKLTTWKFMGLISGPIIILISMYLFKKFIIPILS